MFDGQFRSRKNINLAGSSRHTDRDHLIQQAILERKKREEEKKQQQAATKIQSVFRSYIARKTIKNEFRIKFKSLFKCTPVDSVDQIETLLSYFVTFFDERIDQDDLIKFSHHVNKNKEKIVERVNKKLEYSLIKFLAIHLNLLNKSSLQIPHAVSLRLIEYFTEPKSNHNTNNQQAINKITILKLLITKHAYLNHLVKYAIQKIPNTVQNEIQAPLIFSLGHLIYGAFLCFSPINEAFNELIVNKLFVELFAQANCNQIKCIILKIAEITSNDHSIDNIVCFLNAITKSYSEKDAAASSALDYQEFMLVLYSILKIVTPIIDRLNIEQFVEFIEILKLLILKILQLDLNFETKSMNKEEEDDEEDAMIISTDDQAYASHDRIEYISNEIFQMLDAKLFTHRTESLFLLLINNDMNGDGKHFIDSNLCFSTSYICYFMLKLTKFKLHESVLLRKIAFNKFYLHKLWKIICSMTFSDESSNEIYYLHILASGNLSRLSQNDLYKIVAPLSTFCSLYNLFLLPILDEEFLKGEAVFTKLELIKMSSILKDVCLGIIQLMHPETAAVTSVCTSISFQKHQPASNYGTIDLKLKKQASCFTLLFQSCAQLVQRLYIRDIRAGFCKEDHWLSTYMKLVSLIRLSDILQAYEPTILTNIKFGQASYLFQDEIDNENRQQLNVNDIRSLTILQELPFTVAFKDRLQILESFIHQEPRNMYSEPAYKLRIRRDFLYEDAFDNLSVENVPNLKSTRLVVEMINQLGLEEAGIDGGGVYREFMLRLLETAFDPNRGYFVLTSDGFLYPNPNIGFLIENFEQHYYFLGRLLAKAVQCKILTPIKFAMFFLQKILSKNSDTRLDIDYLASLDPEVYKNLLFLKDLKSNVQDLELNFALNLNEFGETSLVELKPGGKDIYVTSDNKIEYIHLLANFKLNKQIHNQVIAFRNGMSNVINLELLRFFNFNELQFLISGSDEQIDVDDWQANTVYSGIYSSDNMVIQTFWSVVESFSEEQKRMLLKFVTSRSRTPLFGFKNLIPNFAIHPSGSERLPTASTCLNLLKLPPIKDFDLLKEKLICAIESDAGFELS